ncbi:OmpA family protein [Leptospira sp. GIMC2001]|uniref:OmpA family protein n=1 Tax=Leptospira sp. GIMC2001 TaxID=1513297 RepID=UPI00234A679D|nr:OmpA family protein [Leptospira sp. GIMC2001]WCL49143.1 OmpA family protein [Leptospira sp. GIMC2001]
MKISKAIIILFLNIFFYSTHIHSESVTDIQWRETLSLEQFNELENYRKNSNQIREFLDNKKGKWSYFEFRLVEILVGEELESNRLENAKLLWQKYKPKLPNQDKRIESLIGLLSKEKDQPVLKNIGPALNSEFAEYLPVIELSGDRFYFTALNRPGGSGGEDIWYSEYNRASSKWESALPLKEINTPDDESLISISADGTTLIVSRKIRNQGTKSSVFMVRLTENGWSKPQVLPAFLNSESFDGDFFLTADGRAILFASDRDDTIFKPWKRGVYRAGDYHGNSDIYVSLIEDDGTISQPKNLGLSINTEFAERFPHLDSDGKTLYFSSNGYSGFGDLDVYKSEKLEESWDKWSTPVNLGPIVNSLGTDIGFRTDSTGSKAYFAGLRSDSLGETDIYELSSMPDDIAPVGKIVMLAGKVTNQKSKALSAMVQWKREASQEYEGKLFSKPSIGNYAIPLLTKNIYNILITANGFENVEFKLDISEVSEFQEIKKDFIMETIKTDQLVLNDTLKNQSSISNDSIDNERPIINSIGIAKPATNDGKFVQTEKPFPLEEIYFEKRSDKIPSFSFDYLRKISEYLVENPDKKILIRGFGNEGQNINDDLLWSNKRAENVRKFLLIQGVSSKQIISLGVGRLESKDRYLNDYQNPRFQRKAVLSFHE